MDDRRSEAVRDGALRAVPRAVAAVAIAIAAALLWSGDRASRAKLGADAVHALDPRAGAALDGPLFGHRAAPIVALPATGLPEDAPSDARALFGDDVVAVSYAAPTVVVTRGGARFEPGDELPSGAVLRSSVPGRLTVVVDGVESPLEAIRRDPDRSLRLD